MRRFHRAAHVAIWLTLAWALPLIGISAYALRGVSSPPAAERVSEGTGE